VQSHCYDVPEIYYGKQMGMFSDFCWQRFQKFSDFQCIILTNRWVVSSRNQSSFTWSNWIGMLPDKCYVPLFAQPKQTANKPFIDFLLT
jgi:hypothetical protein